MCNGDSSYTTDNTAGITAAPSYPCQPTWTGSSPSITPSAVGTENTTVRLIMVVSLWSRGTSCVSPYTNCNFNSNAYNAATSSLQLTFTASAWSTQLVRLWTITPPSAPAAASSLSGVLGAQALAAPGVAALAAAAALY